MRALLFSWIAALCALLLPASAAQATPVRYDFHLIASTRGPFQEIRNVAINKSGTVAFVALQKSGDVGVFSARGDAPLTTISRAGGGNFVSINDIGTVAFDRITGPDNGGGGLFTGSGGMLTTVVSDGSVYYPSINNHGSIAFRRVFGSESGPPEAFAFVSINGRVNQVSDSFDACEPAINNKNTVLFGRCAPLVGSISISNAGERSTQVLDTNDAFDSLQATTINDRGTIAFFGRKKTGEVGVFTVTSGRVNVVASSQVSHGGRFFAFTPEIALNNKGDVAFLAYLTQKRLGIFTGPNPTSNKVIAVGDPLFGSVVTALAFSREGLNEKGEFAFRATLANGSRVVAKASPH